VIISINIFATAKSAADMGAETTAQPTEAWGNGHLTDQSPMLWSWRWRFFVMPCQTSVMWMHHYNLEKKMESMVRKLSIWPANSRFKTNVNVRKEMVTIFCNIQTIFTFSELWYIRVCANDQQDAHFFSLIYFDLIIYYMFWTNNCSSSGGYVCTCSI